MYPFMSYCMSVLYISIFGGSRFVCCVRMAKPVLISLKTFVARDLCLCCVQVVSSCCISFSQNFVFSVAIRCLIVVTLVMVSIVSSAVK